MNFLRALGSRLQSGTSCGCCRMRLLILRVEIWRGWAVVMRHTGLRNGNDRDERSVSNCISGRHGHACCIHHTATFRLALVRPNSHYPYKRLSRSTWSLKGCYLRWWSPKVRSEETNGITPRSRALLLFWQLRSATARLHYQRLGSRSCSTSDGLLTRKEGATQSWGPP
jgi:hypothetical protein